MFDFVKGWRRKAVCVSVMALLCGGVLLMTRDNSNLPTTQLAPVPSAITTVEPVPSDVDVSTDPNSDTVWVDKPGQINGIPTKGYWRRKTRPSLIDAGSSDNSCKFVRRSLLTHSADHDRLRDDNGVRLVDPLIWSLLVAHRGRHLFSDN